ncbi:NAD(P)H-dependent glycerol-3-phosphate dehydrogenase [Oricola cellulosilytica]|uniref:Glycerol-3-phosphate dehydrogenase [NAD(P)+] n=1 Tax=Oricola cellulosilytica TaxID=1429082 RepID=A0A4R0PFM6_9HYPH|nr:NAD(P)H-dependent glycerol-3-phosphate dehydrogenase [Oricola cellulosilytica]TCD15888.1 NAD(P)-dependent glycerol-3-phosphate dehydrogenase [Oricola cellulosilytica]
MSGKIAVVGAGAWGTALAASVVRAGWSCLLLGRDSETAAKINELHRNPRYLGEIELPETLRMTLEPAEALAGAEIVLVAVPAQTVSSALPGLAAFAAPGSVFVSCAKGIDRETGRTMSGLMATLVGNDRAAVLSGPSFAIDVAAGLPTAVTVAASDIKTAKMLAESLSNPVLRCYASDDIPGVELGGALKNVLAIAAGIVHGRQLGASALAALTTRGFAELRRVAAALGGRPETLVGLSGLGDLILTCGSEKSRNFAYGAAIGRGAPLDELALAEGVKTAAMAARIAREHGVEAPIIAAVDAVLDGGLSVEAAIDRLMSRPLKTET